MSEHTPPLLEDSIMTMSSKDWARLNSGELSFLRSGQDVLAVVWGETDEEERANARRFAAAWNATRSLPTEALEAGVVEEMVEVPKEIDTGNLYDGIQKARALLSKLGRSA